VVRRRHHLVDCAPDRPRRRAIARPDGFVGEWFGAMAPAVTESTDSIECALK
jgi:hypothetical protein